MSCHSFSLACTLDKNGKKKNMSLSSAYLNFADSEKGLDWTPFPGTAGISSMEKGRQAGGTGGLSPLCMVAAAAALLSLCNNTQM